MAKLESVKLACGVKAQVCDEFAVLWAPDGATSGWAEVAADELGGGDLLGDCVSDHRVRYLVRQGEDEAFRLAELAEYLGGDCARAAASNCDEADRLDAADWEPTGEDYHWLDKVLDAFISARSEDDDEDDGLREDPRRAFRRGFVAECKVIAEETRDETYATTVTETAV